ncbi:MAG: hypothetical protein LBN20_04715, partial [Endomicrobium sp.]|nr:hypothetical protein [Endomicrobium sp.]
MKFQLGQDLIDVIRGKKKVVSNTTLIECKNNNLCCPLCMDIFELQSKNMIAYCHSNARKLLQQYIKSAALKKKKKFLPIQIEQQFNSQFSMENIKRVYNFLSDEHSKYRFVYLITLRVLSKLGFKYKFDHKKSTDRYPVDMPQEIVKSINSDKTFPSVELLRESQKNSRLLDLELPIYFFHEIIENHVLKLLHLNNILKGWEQYYYNSNDYEPGGEGSSRIIDISDGDYVIDGGGFQGETALYFAAKVGTKGMIYSFEVLPQNIKVFNKNLEINPELASNIK